MEPPVSVPSDPAITPVLTATAEPLDEPPGTRSLFQGFRTSGKRGIDTGRAQSEFCCLKYADRNGPGVCKAFQRSRCEIGPEILQDWRPSAESFVTPVENILVRQWNTMQRARRCACSALAICFTGSLQRCFSFDPHKTIQVLVYFLSVVDAGLSDLEHTCVAC